MENYTVFADIYDEFMDNIPYEKWASYVCSILQENGVHDCTIAELGCGTGTITRLLAGCGYDMIGIDISGDMLTRAREIEYGQETARGILYLLQDMREFELAYQVQGIVSLCDSMNYMRDAGELGQVLHRVCDNLTDGGIFIFDMKTEHLYRDVMGNAASVDEREDAVLIWDNEYDDNTRDNTYYITMFLQTADTEGLYERYDERHVQHAFSIDEVSGLVRENGMELLNVYNEGTVQQPDDMSERVYFVCKK